MPRSVPGITELSNIELLLIPLANGQQVDQLGEHFIAFAAVADTTATPISAHEMREPALAEVSPPSSARSGRMSASVVMEPEPTEPG